MASSQTLPFIYAFIQAIMQLIVKQKEKLVYNRGIIEECEKLPAAVGRKLLAVSVSHREVPGRPMGIILKGILVQY